MLLLTLASPPKVQMMNKPFPKMFCLFALATVNVALCTAHGIAEQPSASPAPIGRFLLVASEGLYIVESDGKPSWSYNPPAYKGQGLVKYDDLVYDGRQLPDGHFLYAAHRYAREIDREKRTIWEYRVSGTTEVKTAILLPDGNVAVLNSGEQAILELERGSGKVLRRISLPAKGTDHTRYNLLRRTPGGTYLAALRDEKRFVEVTHDGAILHSYPVTDLPVMAERLADGSTLCSGRFGLKKFDSKEKETWSYTAADAAPQFPLLIAAGFLQLPDQSLLVVNSDWHYKKEGDNRVQLFALTADKKIFWTLAATTFKGWKPSEIDPTSKLVEHRCMVVQRAGGAGDVPHERVLFEDQFNGKLADGWSWLYEDKENWRIEGGKLQIRATGGSSFMKEHNGKNYLLRTPPDVKNGEFSAEAYIENKPTEQWEHAGLLWFYDDDHYVILNKERNNYDHKTSIMFAVEKDGKVGPAFPDPAYEAEGVWLRFRVNGKHIVGEFRATPADAWREVGNGELPEKGPPTVGLHAGYAPKKDLNRWASFSHFKIAEVVKE